MEITNRYIKNIHSMLDNIIDAKIDLYNQLQIGYNDGLSIEGEIENTENIREIYEICGSLLDYDEVLDYIHSETFDEILRILRKESFDYQKYFQELKNVRETDPSFVPNDFFFRNCIKDINR